MTATTVKFASQWQHEQDGALRPGGTLRIEYDLARLTCCRSERYGRAAWSIAAYVRFHPEQQAQSADVSKGAAELTIPANTTRVEMWFHNTDQTGCSAWDSNYGLNYSFDVA